MTPTFFIALGLYFALVIGVGFFRFRTMAKRDYVTAPNSTGFVPLTLSLLGTIVGGAMFLGVTQLGFEGGMTAFALGLAYLFGSVILGLFAPTIRRLCTEHETLTLFGFINCKYPPTGIIAVATVLSWITFAVFFLMLAGQFLGIATFLSHYSALRLEYSVLIVASVVAVISTISYSVFGGFIRDVWTDIVQMLFIFVGVILIFRYGMDPAHLQSRLATLPPEYFAFGSKSAVLLVGSLLFVAPTFIVRFDLWQRIVTAKSDLTAKASFIVTGVVAFFFFAFFGILGMYAKSVGVTDSRFAALEVIQSSLAGVPYSLALAAFFAAVMSSADTFLGVAGLALARIFIKDAPKAMESEANDKAFVRKVRQMTLTVGLISVVVAWLMADILNIFATAFGFLMVFLPSAIAAIAAKKPNAKAALGSVALGLAAMLPLVPFYPTEAFLPGVLVSGGAYFVINRFFPTSRLSAQAK